MANINRDGVDDILARYLVADTEGAALDGQAPPLSPLSQLSLRDLGVFFGDDTAAGNAQGADADMRAAEEARAGRATPAPNHVEASPERPPSRGAGLQVEAGPERALSRAERRRARRPAANPIANPTAPRNQARAHRPAPALAPAAAPVAIRDINLNFTANNNNNSINISNIGNVSQ